MSSRIQRLAVRYEEFCSLPWERLSGWTAASLVRHRRQE